MLELNSAPVGFDYAYKSGPNRDTTKAIDPKLDDAEEYNTRGIAYSENGKQDRAIADYNKVIELKPDYANAYNNRGIAYGVKGDFDRAITDFNKTIKLNPNSANAYNNRGVAYGLKDEVDLAIADYNKAIKLKPDYAAAYNNRGIAYRDKGDFDRAIADYNKTIKLKPDYAAAYNNRGAAYDKKRDFDLAIADYNKAIELKPNYVEPYTNRGVAYDKKRDFDLAIADHNTAIKLKPDYAEAYNNRGIAYFNKGDFDRAIENYNTAIELKSDDAIAYYTRGVTRLHLQAWEEAKSDLTTARNMGVDITAEFCNIYGSVAGFEQITGIRLPADIAAMLTPQVIAMRNKEAWEATHELASDAEIGLDELLENYARAWKTLAEVPLLEGSSVHADLDDLAPTDIEKALQKVRAEAEEERRLDQELDAIPETAYQDVDRFLKTINKLVPLPDIMPLDNGEICLEWREGQKIFTLSFGGDGHIVFAGIFGAENHTRGILTFSMPHLIAVIGMITSLYLHYDY